MCPDKEILSAFIDNELEGEFKKIIQNHVSVCKKCRSEIESLNSLHKLFYDELSFNQIKDAEEKVWNKIVPALRTKPQKPYVWQRRIAIPVPVMAAALLIFVSAVISLYSISFSKINNSNSEPGFNFSESITFDMEEDFNLFEVDQVFDLDLSLPETTTFIISGAPRLIREVDFLSNNR